MHCISIFRLGHFRNDAVCQSRLFQWNTEGSFSGYFSKLETWKTTLVQNICFICRFSKYENIHMHSCIHCPTYFFPIQFVTRLEFIVFVVVLLMTICFWRNGTRVKYSFFLGMNFSCGSCQIDQKTLYLFWLRGQNIFSHKRKRLICNENIDIHLTDK